MRVCCIITVFTLIRSVGIAAADIALCIDYTCHRFCERHCFLQLHQLRINSFIRFVGPSVSRTVSYTHLTLPTNREV